MTKKKCQRWWDCEQPHRTQDNVPCDHKQLQDVPLCFAKKQKLVEKMLENMNAKYQG